GRTARPRPEPPIRFKTDEQGIRTPPRNSRHVPNAVRRVVYVRDEGRCAFVSAEGRRCTERVFLEFHHGDPYARQGPATPKNIYLGGRAHNRYEGELVFGPRRPDPRE